MKNLMYIVIGFLILILAEAMGADNNYLFSILVNLLLVIIITLYNKLSFVTLLVICSNLIIIPIIIQYYTGQSYGLLQLDLVPLHIEEILRYVYFYNSSILILSMIFRISKKERENIRLQYKKISMSNLSIIFSNCVAIMFTIVAFPRLSLGSAVNQAERFNMLLPGHAWNQLAIVALVINLPYLRYRSVKLTYLFCIMWFFLNGERADVAGLIFGIVIYYLTILEKISIKKQLLILMASFFLAYVMVIIGNFRIGTKGNENQPFLINLLTFSTISDVGYLLNTTVDYISHGIFLGGKTLLSNFYQVLPFSKTSNDFPSVIGRYYPNPGGEPIISAALLDFGALGIPIIALIDLTIVKLLTIAKSKLFHYEYLLLLCSIPRIAWYGRNFTFSGVFFFIPIMLICITFLDRLSQKNGNFKNI